MDYMSLSSALRSNKLLIFTLRDVKNLFPAEKEKTIKNNFVRWRSKGYFVRLKNGLYEFIEKGSEPRIPDLYVANRLYEPSYISLESALSFYSIIPDIAAGVTCVTSRPTRTFRNKYGSFFYRSCRRRAFTGYRLMLYDGFKIQIADKEKALVDFLYYRLRAGFPIDFDAERFNSNVLKSMNWRRAFYYAGLFNTKTAGILKKCKEHMKC